MDDEIEVAMPRSIEKSALMKYLSNADNDLHAKAMETRGRVASLLARIPATFENYTDHSVEHSDEIIRRLSFLLFDSSTDECVVRLSAAETYILVIAALMHDTGMVVTPQEKINLVGSPEWAKFTAQDSIKQLWRNLSDGSKALDGDAQYLRDLETRYLVAEYFRRSHASRAANTIISLEHELAGFAYGDPALKRTIADICAGHGLDMDQLDDTRKFPFQRELLGEKVNVRLLAILLRLGDLLDVRFDRACPLIFSASSPIPAFSEPHWTQYHRMEHYDVTPARVEFRAACETQEEHRLLADWFAWLEVETREAKRLLATSTRHSEWSPPLVRLNKPHPTVEIRPAATATYRPVDWRFELDPDAVFRRLIKDAYSSELSFLGELIQNAVDANRVALSNDYQSATGIQLADTRDAPANFRAQYPLRVEVTRVSAATALQPDAERLVVTVTDAGIGMSEQTISKYLLQVGKSYYKSADFDELYKFVPTSQFGVGFLSVFAVSSLVTLDTRSRETDESRLLTVTGPRSYLLFEKSSRSSYGTAVKVQLDKQIAEQDIIDYLLQRVAMVEFPFTLVDSSGLKVQDAFVGSDDAPSSALDVTLETGEIARCEVIEVQDTEVRGQLRLSSLELADGSICWDPGQLSLLQERFPLLDLPQPGSAVTCLNGLATPRPDFFYPGMKDFAPSHRIDARGRSLVKDVNLARDTPANVIDLLSPYWENAIREHLLDPSRAFSGSSKDWLYKQTLITAYPAKEAFWTAIDGTIRAFRDGELTLRSIDDVSREPEISILIPRYAFGRSARSIDLSISDEQRELVRNFISDDSGETRIETDSYRSIMQRSADAFPDIIIWGTDVDDFSEVARRILIRGRHVTAVQAFEGWEIVTLAQEPLLRNLALPRYPYELNRVSVAHLNGFEPDTLKVDEHVTASRSSVLNVDHELTDHLLRLKEGDLAIPGLSKSAATRAVNEVLSLGFDDLSLLEGLVKNLHDTGFASRLYDVRIVRDTGVRGGTCIFAT